MAQPIPSPDTSLPKPEVKAVQPQAKPPDLVEMNRLRSDFDSAQSVLDKNSALLKTAQAAKAGTAKIDSPDYQLISKRQQGGEPLDEIISKTAENARRSSETTLDKELPYREAEAALLISEVGSPATDHDIVKTINALEQNQAIRLDDPSLAEVNRRKQAGESLTGIKSKAQEALDAKNKQSETLRIAELMKRQTARPLGTDIEASIKDRMQRGESLDDIIAKTRADLSHYDEVDNKKGQLVKTLQRIEEIKSEKQVIAGLKKGEQESAAQQQIQQARQKLEGITGEKQPKDPKTDINMWRNKFKELQQTGIADDVKEGMVGNSMWQQIRYGEEAKGGNDQQYRGYLMVEPDNFPLALEILSKTAEQRKAQGKTTEFKWLLKTEEPNWADKIASGQDWKPKEIGEYPYLRPEDPRIALYGDSQQDIQEVISALAKHPQWQTIEESRIKALAGKAPRRPGSNSFIDTSGHEWRTLNYNNKPGYSEDEAKNPQWRNLKSGTPTGNL